MDPQTAELTIRNLRLRLAVAEAKEALLQRQHSLSDLRAHSAGMGGGASKGATAAKLAMVSPAATASHPIAEPEPEPVVVLGPELAQQLEAADAKAKAQELQLAAQAAHIAALTAELREQHRQQHEKPAAAEAEAEKTEAAEEPEAEAAAEDGAGEESTDADPFAKFVDGYDGNFADVNAFFGGLPKLIGEPRKDVPEAIRDEHCDVLPPAFGASDVERKAPNYNVFFTPRREYLFVADPNFHEHMAREVDPRTKMMVGERQKIDIAALMAAAVQRMRAAFATVGLAKEAETAVTQPLFDALAMTTSELVALRLYTGPCFILYNGVLRAMASGGVVPRGPDQGKAVRGAFVTTIHAINSGVIKLSRLQPAIPIFRGVNGMRLPTQFTKPNAHNIKGGVEYGFSSFTTDRAVAVHYSGGGKLAAAGGDEKGKRAHVVFETRMGMVNRGAFLGWLSQYPEEAEILIPPLTGLEVLGFRQADDGLLEYSMALNCNLQSMTIEEVLAVRKKQCVELLDVVTRGVTAEVSRPQHAGDAWLAGRLSEAEARSAALAVGP
eukprot:SAG22_NODE_401_length_11080_cov_18.258082_5_plen_553_part_00